MPTPAACGRASAWRPAGVSARIRPRPIVVNNYSIFATDIRPKGFHLIEFDGTITDETVWWTERLLQDPALVKEMTDHNYSAAARHYSYAVLHRHLQALLTDLFGEPAGGAGSARR